MKEPSFWSYSLREYRRAAVEPACLALQDEGANVNLLLACCWLGSSGRRADRRRLRRLLNAVASWQEQVVVPLRQVRRSLKPETWQVDAGGRRALRQRVAAAELEAEHLEQLLLASLVVDLPQRPGRNFSSENLQGYAALLELDFGPRWRALLAAVGGGLAAPC